MIIPPEWKENLKKLEEIIKKHNLDYNERCLVVEMYHGYLFNYFKGYDVEGQDFMIEKSEALKGKKKNTK